MLTSLVYLQQGNVKKSKKLIKIVNTGEDYLHIFQTTTGIFMKLSRKMCLMIILKVTKNHGFTLSLENAVLQKQQGGQTDPPPAFYGLKDICLASSTRFLFRELDLYLETWSWSPLICTKTASGMDVWGYVNPCIFMF